MSGDTGGAISSDVRDAQVLAATELRCRLRSIRDRPRRLLATAFLVVLFAGVFPLVLYGVVSGYGAAFASSAVPVGETGVAILGAAGVGLYLGGASGFGQEPTGDVSAFVRTAVPPRAVSLGRLCTELGLSLAIVTLVSLSLLVEVAIGAASPVPAVVLGFGLVPVGAASLAVGRVLGTGLRAVNRRLQVSLWTKAALYLGLTAAIYVVTYRAIDTGIDGAEGPGSIFPAAFLPGEPLQAYASVILAPLGATPRPLGAVVLAFLLVLGVLGTFLTLRLETQLLLADPSDSEKAQITGTKAVPRLFALTPAARVAWRYLLRTRRDPRMLAHMVGLLFGALGIVGSALSDPHSLETMGPGVVVVGGAVVAGAAYGLNPLGDDRDQLPLLLTSTPSVGVLLRGRGLAGMVLGLVLAVGVGVPVGLLVHPPGAVLAQSLFAVFLSVAGVGTALGIGAVVPRFDNREYMSVERAHPSTMGLIGFMIGGTFVGAIGLVLVWWALGQGPTIAVLVAWAMYLLVVGGIAVAGYVYAVRTFERLELDEV